MRMALLQTRSAVGEREETIGRLSRAASEAAAAGAALMIAPELVVGGYGAGEDLGRVAEAMDGPTAQRLADVARGTGVALVYGYAERAGDAVYNAARFVAPDGTTVNYRKCQLYGPYERAHFLPGPEAPPVFCWGGLRLGLLICYDVEFPETVRFLARGGVDLVCVPTALPATPSASMIAARIVPVRAFENQVFIAYGNLVGSDARYRYAGLSCVVAPDGTDLARADGTAEGLLIADIDPAAYQAARDQNPYLADVRTDLY